MSLYKKMLALFRKRSEQEENENNTVSNETK